MDMLNQSLNSQQVEAVEHNEGPLLVLAGAGSGKTKVVTFRIVRLLNLGISPYRILGLTFTNKAANEMKERVKKLTNHQVLITTFHSLGARILRESIHLLGYHSDFAIYDEEDSEKLLRACLGDLVLADKKGDFKAIRSMISKAKNDFLNPSEVDISEMPESAALVFPEVYASYQARLKESQAVDFDDLLFLAVKIFKEHPEALNVYQNRWTYFLIDEYQDTNAAQYLMVKMLAAKNTNLCVVGDPDQSIYSWRGASISNILNFEKDYPNAHVVRLEQNYRSRGNILEVANSLIENNQNRYHKHLWSDLGEGEKVKHFVADDERDEAEFVLSRIKFHQGKGISLNDMVVFYRTNAQSRVFEDYLLFNRIPYSIVGGISFYQRKEIKDILAFLRMLTTGADFVAFSRSINIPKRGIGEATLDKIRSGAVKEGLSIFEYCRLIAEGKASVKVSLKQRESLKDYVGIIEKLRADLCDMSLTNIIKETIHDSGYLRVLKEDPESYEDRRSNLDELVSKAAEWESEGSSRTLTAFLEELSLKSSLDEAEQAADRLKLMTLHNGKGLEFTVTFLVGLEEDLLPHINSKNDPQALEEERRLCYVGITRAKEYLYLSYARARLIWGMLRNPHPSRFLREIPIELRERIFKKTPSFQH